MPSTLESNSTFFLSPSPTRISRNDWETHESLDSFFVPSITIERPSSPVSITSQLSSEPLDSALWDQRNSYLLNHEELTIDTSRSASGSSSYASSFHSESQASPMSRSTTPALTEDPPDYTTTVQRPTDPVQYEFSPTSYNSMIVMSGSDAQAPRPKYHIAVTMNCFMPLCHITTIRRGGSELGQYVAQFEMGISQGPSTVTIDGSQVLISSALSKRTGTRSAGIWLWTPPDKAKGVLWNCRTVPFSCRSVIDIGSGSEESLLANFTPAGHDHGQASVAKLTVRPKGQHFFDDLLLSLLIIERKRLTPGKGKILKQLFN
ncbi:hypothetical protein GALMADRAFT_231799 [Galerina marginata CBS 339.88]|uniref:DUF6593 domain-containing protein n=1 Tax=Galerina marginata (strain CBS 339.88) TaxID=685588 RepID=A0A067S9U1_GALM3|nr:hypothetical protein GALMADRAFT_231799 [Galerina marginata CBS 339.88]